MPTAFNCSMCSAPLDVAHVTGPTVLCRYCGNTSILPEELRGFSTGRAAMGGKSGSLGSMVDQAMKMAEVAQLARAGNKIAAIKLYREIFGCGLKEAKDAVEQMGTGQPIVLTHADFQSGHPSSQPFQAAELIGQVVTPQVKKAGRWAAVIIVILIVVPVIFAVFKIISAVNAVQQSVSSMPGMPVPGPRATASPTPTFAAPALEFGSEGIGAGQFKDARSTAIDGEGRIYVGEYSGGRVQVFDSQGKFLTQWMVDPKKALLNLAADRKGTVYIVHPGVILRYEGTTGNLLGEVAKPGSNRNEFYTDAFVALDGSLYAISSNSDITRIGPDGDVKNVLQVKQKVGDDVHFDKVAVNGSGYIFLLETRENNVYKLAPDGKFINKFGGKGKETGQLDSPHNIAVDGQGRVYVSDLGRGVQVFDTNGRYIDSFGGREVIFGIAINDRNEIFATGRNLHKIVKYVPIK